jgi:sugar phosphate isomerase/epimerase
MTPSAWRERLAVGHYTMRSQPLDADVALLERLGVRAIGLARSKLEAFGMAESAALLRASGLHVAHLSSYGWFGTTARSVRRGMDEVRRALAWLHDLRGDVLVLISGGLGRASWDDAARALADAHAALLPEARAAGIRLALEIIHPLRRDLSFVHTLADARRIAGPRGGYVLDVWHSCWEPHLVETIRRDARRHVVAVQLSDWKKVTLRTLDRAPLGRGILPLGEIVAALEGGGYRGWYEIEIISDDLEAMGYEAALRHTLRAFARLRPG